MGFICYGFVPRKLGRKEDELGLWSARECLVKADLHPGENPARIQGWNAATVWMHQTFGGRRVTREQEPEPAGPESVTVTVPVLTANSACSCKAAR